MLTFIALYFVIGLLLAIADRWASGKKEKIAWHIAGILFWPLFVFLIILNLEV